MTTDHWFHCHFRQRASIRGLLSLPLQPLLVYILVRNLVSRIFCELNQSSRNKSKLFQIPKTKCPRFLEGIALPAPASRHLLPTARGSLLLIATWGRRLVVVVAGNWYYSRSHRFLLSVLPNPTVKKLLCFHKSFRQFFRISLCWNALLFSSSYLLVYIVYLV